MSKTVAWGILGTGRIAHAFAGGVTHSDTGYLAAVGSRTAAAAETFGAAWQIPQRHASYEALLADPTVQAVYIATPHPWHARWALRAAEAGKHILCEKPMALNAAEGMAMIEAAHRYDVFLMEAFMYRCHPQTVALVDLIRRGAIGQVRLINATFGFDAGFNPEGRLLNNALGGGGILDVGGYCTSMARLLAGAALGLPFVDPLTVSGSGRVGATRVDEDAVALLTFPEGITAQVAVGVRLRLDNAVRVYGTEGTIEVTDPWVPSVTGGTTEVVVRRYDEEVPQRHSIDAPHGLYAYEADTVAAALADRQAPAMSWDDTLGNLRTQDRWRAALGVVYDAETARGSTGPLRGGRLTPAADSIMAYGRVAGIEKPISRLVLGVDNQPTFAHAAVMFDDFYERGGTCFDTAYIYMGGQSERLLGEWVRSRGVREQVVILDKGAHTPHCTPQALTTQLIESLERLQTDYVDLYMLHRDNPEVPVDEFMAVLNEQRAAGRMRAFGASNWSIERIEAANAWARARGLTPFVAMSSNFSLARMIDPVWPGCIAASDGASRTWLTAHRDEMVLMPWSSQARGFFTERAAPDRHDDTELVRCWYSDDNFERRARAVALAEQRGVLPIQIALAYVLCQPFPTFPLIGPRTLAETRTSFPALTVQLTPDDLRWLNLEV